MDRVFIKVTRNEAGERLDIYLVQKKVLPTRSQIRKLIDQEKIKVNGFPVKASYRINETDHILIEIPKAQESFLIPENLSIHILYEDRDLIVVNKEAGQTVHPGAGIKRGTLVNALLYHCKDLSGIGGVVRPGVVHRLDKNTSGVIVFAKNDKTHLDLAEQFKKRTVQRRYLTLVFGKMKDVSGTFSEPIGRHPVYRKKMSTKSRHGKSALTFWKVLESFEQMSLIEAILATGRTHQIRVHFSDAGHPVVGDSTYGGVRRIKGIVDLSLRRVIQKLPALLLHAQSLSFRHPTLGKTLSFQVPLPSYFQDMLKILRDE